MRNGSFFIPREQIYPFLNPGAMNNQEGINVYWETEPAAARRVLPPQLELLDPEHPIATVYIVNIKEPTFAPWYMEAGLYLLCRYGETPGVYFLNLQLSGPGATCGLTSGREFSGLPKKVCERIVVERNGDWAHAIVEAKGRRIFDVQIEIDTTQPATPKAQEVGSCFLFQYAIQMGEESADNPDGHMTFPTMQLNDYRSVTDYRTWEPAGVLSIDMEPSLDDPWAELEVVKPLAANYSISSNWVAGYTMLEKFEGKEADDLMSYLYTGRWDRSLISSANQRYGQF